MKKNNRLNNKLCQFVLTAGISVLALVPTITAYADPPSISCNEVEGTTAPGGKVIPPYTYKFAVSDDYGINSIKVDGKELHPDGGTDYEGTWTCYTSKDITITVTDTAGNTVKKKISKDGTEGDLEIVKQGEEESRSVTVETVYVTVVETAAPTTAAPTASPPPTTTTATLTTSVAPTTTERVTIPETQAVRTPSTKETAEETLPAALESTETETLPEETEESTEATAYTIPETTRKIYVETETSQAKKISIITEPLVIDKPELPDLTGFASMEEEYLEKLVIDTVKETENENHDSASHHYAVEESKVDFYDTSTASASNASDVNGKGNIETETTGINAKGELKSIMAISIGILLLAVLAVYNIFVVRLNRKRLRLYKAFLFAVSKKDNVDTNELVNKYKTKKEGKSKKSRKERKKNAKEKNQ